MTFNLSEIGNLESVGLKRVGDVARGNGRSASSVMATCMHVKLCLHMHVSLSRKLSAFTFFALTKETDINTSHDGSSSGRKTSA